jgi:hypothetical protein
MPLKRSRTFKLRLSRVSRITVSAPGLVRGYAAKFANFSSYFKADGRSPQPTITCSPLSALVRKHLVMLIFCDVDCPHLFALGRL